MWKRIQQLLQQTNKSTAGLPVVHEVLERSEAYMNAYQGWQYDGNSQVAIDWLKTNYQSMKAGGKMDRAMAFLDTPSRKGFVLYLTDGILETADPEYLMDVIRDRVCDQSYVLYTSDLKRYVVGEEVETLQRHYLKPPLQFVPDQKLDQLFGNIAIEYLLRNDKPYMFKFSATTYTDHMYKEPLSFDELMTSIF